MFPETSEGNKYKNVRIGERGARFIDVQFEEDLARDDSL